jgi:hypothetical protein
MPRIRSHKPDFWSHPVMGRQEDKVKTMALALLNLADDYGYFYADPATVRSFARPFDDDSKISLGCLQQLMKIDYIDVRQHSVRGFVGRVISFDNHQRVDKPKPSVIKRLFDESVSVIVLGLIPDDSTMNLAGKEGKGKEDNTPLPPTENEAPKTTSPDADFRPSECAPVVRVALGISGQRNWITSTEAIETHMVTNPEMTAKQSAEEIARLWPVYRASPQYKRFPMNPEKWLSSGEFLRSENWSRSSDVAEFPTRASPAVTSTDASELIRERKEKLKAHKASNGKD